MNWTFWTRWPWGRILNHATTVSAIAAFCYVSYLIFR